MIFSFTLEKGRLSTLNSELNYNFFFFLKKAYLEDRIENPRSVVEIKIQKVRMESKYQLCKLNPRSAMYPV